MPSLLSIPRELRDEILALIVQDGPKPRVPPPPPQDASQQEELQAWAGGLLKNKNEPVKWNRTETMPTLLVNWQLHEETLAALALFRGKSGLRPFHLHLIIAHELAIWPTWLSIPEYTKSVTKSIDTIYANIQVQGTYTPIQSIPRRTGRVSKTCYPRSGFAQGNASPPYIVLHFFSLLARCLKEGPPRYGREKELDAGAEDDEEPDAGFSIKNLELNFVTPDTSEYTIIPKGRMEDHPTRYGQHCLVTSDIRTPREEDGIDYVISADLCLSFIDCYIQKILYMDRDVVEYGKLLFERIGKIRLSLDGELQKEVNLAERLRELEFHGKFAHIAHGEAKFNKWKVEAREKRISTGLEVCPVESEACKGTGEKEGLQQLSRERIPLHKRISIWLAGLK